MQTSAKTIDANDARAIALIGVYAFYSGCFILLGIATPILRLKVYERNSELVIASMAIALLGWILSGKWSKSVTRSCYYNVAMSFSPQLLITIALFWLSLLLIFSLELNQVLTDGLVSGVWAIAATTLIGVAFRLGITNQPPKDSSSNSPQIKIKGNITITENPQLGQIIISPNSLSQQPQQFKALMCLALSLFTWTILDLPEITRELVAIALGSLGLTGLSTWQILLCPSKRLISLNFSGVWGMASSFTINLVQFCRLETIKLKEVDMQWLQLAGNSRVITFPHTVTDGEGKDSKESRESSSPNLISTLIDRLNLAEHKVSRDLLSVMNILLPQSVCTLAGIVILGMGITLAIVLELPPKMPLETYILLTGCGLVSPYLGRGVMGMVAPSTMIPDQTKFILSPWQVGTGLIMIAIFSGSQFNSQLNSQIGNQNYVESLLALTLIWLCCGVGACILALSVRSPLMTTRF